MDLILIEVSIPTKIGTSYYNQLGYDALKKLANDGRLVYTKSGSRNLYVIRKRNHNS